MNKKLKIMTLFILLLLVFLRNAYTVQNFSQNVQYCSDIERDPTLY